MNIFKNKYFLLGNLAFLLFAIPVILLLVRNQTSTRSGAEASTTISFNPTMLAMNQCAAGQTTKVLLTPGNNEVSTVKLGLTWDTTIFEVDFVPNTTAFPQTLEGPSYTATGMTVMLDVGPVTNVITTPTEIGTLTIKPLAPSNGETRINIDTTYTQVNSLAGSDGDRENVFLPAGSTPLRLSITEQVCSGGTPTPTVSGGANPTATRTPTPTKPLSGTVAPTSGISPTLSNVAPNCISLSATPASGSGQVPFSVTLNAVGRDTNNTISKTTFNFGDGTSQDVTTGMGTASVSAQLAHTYTTPGTFQATSIFTDSAGAVSTACTTVITGIGTGPTATPIAATVAPTTAQGTVPTATPTIESPGGLLSSMGIVGGITLLIFAGIFLLAL